MKLKNLLGLLCLSMLTVACSKKSEEPRPQPEPARKLVGRVVTKVYYATLDQGKFVKGEQYLNVEEEYDSESRLIKTTFIPLRPEEGEDEPEHEIHTYKYNDKGQLVEEQRANQYGRNDFRTVYSYDEEGRLFLELRYEGGYLDSPARTEYTKYNAEGKPIEGLENGRNRLTIKYDDHGNIIERISYSESHDNQVEDRDIYRYEYDRSGNWVKQFWSMERMLLSSDPEIGYYIWERELVWE